MKNDVFNITSDKGVPTIKLAELIRKYMDSKGKIAIKENRTGEVVKFIADISKAKQILSHEHHTAINERIQKIY